MPKIDDIPRCSTCVVVAVISTVSESPKSLKANIEKVYVVFGPKQTRNEFFLLFI